MSTTLRPLGDRVMIRPDQPPAQTASGLWVSEDRKPEQTGTVIAVGRSSHPLREVALDISNELRQAEPTGIVANAAANLLERLVAYEPSVQVGDYVLFSWTAGHEVQLHDDGVTVLVMPESDILAVIGEGVTCE